MPDDNKQEAREEIEKVVETIRDCAYVSEKVDFRKCLSRTKNRLFMARYHLNLRDIRDFLSSLRVEDYSFTSRVTGEKDAYVFGPDTGEDYEVFLKVQIVDGILVLSFHEPEWEMGFPFRRGKTK